MSGGDGSAAPLLDTADDVRGYLARVGLLDRLGDGVEVVDVTGGNMNRVFVARGSVGGLAVKQAPPFVQAAGPGWPMDPDRLAAEARAYELIAPVAAEVVPQIEHVDLDRHLLVMEDLSDLAVLRIALVAQVDDHLAGRTPSPVPLHLAARTVGRFSGALTAATDVHAVSGIDRDALIARAANDELCALTVDVVLDEPYRAHEHNRWHADLDPRVAALHADAEALDAAAALRDRFRTARQALVHGDLHTGSVMVGARGGSPVAVVFDPEFSFVGPAGMDLGLFQANLLIAAEAARAVGATALAAEREAAVATAWRAFDAAHPQLPADEAARIRVDAWRFAGAEAIRRVVGWSHAADLETLPDPLIGPASAAVLDRARHHLVHGEDRA